MDQYEREEQYLEDQFNNGEISMKEYKREIYDLQGLARSVAVDAAYEDEMGKW